MSCDYFSLASEILIPLVLLPAVALILALIYSLTYSEFK